MSLCRTALQRQQHRLLRSSINSTAQFSSYVLEGGAGGSGANRWPIRQTNTIFNIVPEGHKVVVERFGKLHSIQPSGWFLAIPLVDTISYVIDLREKALDIPPQSAITRDNVAVEVSGNLFVQFVDAEKAAYGAFNPVYSIMQVCMYVYIYTCVVVHRPGFYPSESDRESQMPV